MFFIFTTRKDLSLPLIEETLAYKSVTYQSLFYENIHKRDSNHLKNILNSISSTDLILLRDPYNTGTDYSSILKTILKTKLNQIYIDGKFMFTYPNYEDKFEQYLLLKSLNLKVPETAKLCDVISNTAHVKPPFLVKKRISSRAKDIYLLNNWQEVREFQMKNDCSLFIVQELLHPKLEIRVLTFKDQIIGAVEKSSKFKGGREQRVHVTKNSSLPDKQIRDDILRLVNYYSIDFSGLDIILDSTGSWYFIEINISPQFTKFQEITGIDVPEIVFSKIH